MKKIILAVLVCFTIGAQAQSYKEGQIDINAGLGLGNTFIGARNYVGAGYTYQRMPIINVSGEYGVTNAIGVGAYIGYTSFKYSYTYQDWYSGTGLRTYTDTYKWSFLIIGARAAYHFDEFIKIDKLDCYGGLMLGYNIASAKYTSTDPYHGTVYAGTGFGGFAWSLYAGARYRFTDNIGAYAELGYGVSILNLGLNIKLN